MGTVNWLLSATVPFFAIGLLVARFARPTRVVSGMALLAVPWMIRVLIAIGLNNGWWGHQRPAETLTDAILAFTAIGIASSGLGAIIRLGMRRRSAFDLGTRAAGSR